MKTTTITGIASAFFISLICGLEFPSEGNGQSPNGNDAAFISAGRSPNSTHSVKFTHNSVTSPSFGANWTWRVNISEVAVTADTNNIPDARTVFTVYDLQWPSGGTLNQVLAAERNASFGNLNVAGPGLPSCGYLVSGNLPQNVSDSWSPSDGSSCSSVLGDQCVQSIKSGFVFTNNECPFFPSFSSLAGCEDSFGAAGQTSGGIGAFGFTLGNSSAPSNSSSIRGGQGVGWFASEVYSAGNDTEYNLALNTVQIFVLLNQEINVLCQRVGSSPSSTGTQQPSSTSSAPPNSTQSDSAAISNMVTGRSLVSLAVLAAIVSFL